MRRRGLPPSMPLFDVEHVCEGCPRRISGRLPVGWTQCGTSAMDPDNVNARLRQVREVLGVDVGRHPSAAAARAEAVGAAGGTRTARNRDD